MNKSITPFIFENNLLISIFCDLENTNDISPIFYFKNLNLKNIENSSFDVLICDDPSLKKIYDKNIKINNIFVIDSKNHKVQNEIKSDVVNIYLPLKINEIILRIENNFIQKEKKEKRLYEYKNFTYDPGARTLKNDSLSIRFTEKESEIFTFLSQNHGSHVSKKDLLQNIWSYGNTIDTHTLETHLYSLRKKIEDKLKLKNLINFEENKGYSLDKSIL